MAKPKLPKGCCAYCGHITEVATVEEFQAAVVAHIQQCEKHPVRKAALVVGDLVRHATCPCHMKEPSKEYSEAYYAAEAFARSMGVQI